MMTLNLYHCIVFPSTLHWICRDAPIIIHLNLDKCLHFLVKDTHYRNLFETGKGGGGDCTRSRTIWEVGTACMHTISFSLS